MAKLTQVGGSEPFVFEITGAETTIGRGRANMCALKDNAASSRHAMLRKTDDGWEIEDMGSRNGTFVNDAQVKRQAVKSGDRIKVGESTFQFEDDGAAMVVDDSADAGGESDVLVSVSIGTTADDAAADVTTLKRKLNLIHSVSEKLVRIQDDKRLTEEILSLVIKELEADRGFLCMLDEKRAPVPFAKIGLEAHEQPRASRTVLRKVMEDRTAVVIKPQESEEIMSLMQSGVSSTMYAPLWTGDNIIGFMSLDLTTPGRSFSENDLDLVLTIAHQAAVGLERTRLAAVAEKDRQAKAYLSKYLDANIVQTLMQSTGTGEDPLAPTEREATVLFTDIVSFTKMSEGIPPKELGAFIHHYLSAMTDIIFAHGGTIDKYIGDAIMALFGAPIPNEKNALNAINAALEMRTAASQMQPPKQGMGPLRVRYGVNTGLVTVGNLGSSRRTEYTALGDNVNVASRLQTFARPDEIVISEMTFEKPGVADRFTVEAIGNIDVKNRSQPVPVYKVLGLKNADATTKA